MRLRTVGLLAGAVAAICGLSMSAKAATFNLLSAGTTLDQLLIPGNNATVGDLLFTFTGYVGSQTGGNAAPTSAQIAVSAFNSPPISPLGEPGIAFTATWRAVNVGFVDSVITFNVTTTDGRLINDDYLAASGTAPPVSSWQVIETVTPLSAGATLGIIDMNNNSGNTTATATFAPQTAISVSKDINVTNTSTGGAVPGLTDVEQGFSTVPVPAAAWMGLSTLAGLGAMGFFRKRARQA